MREVWESATQEIKERANDPLLRVEIEHGAKEPYVITKFFRSLQDYEEQMRFAFWDPGLVEKALISGRPEVYTSPGYRYNQEKMKARVSAEQRAKMHEYSEAMAEDIYQASDHGTIISSAQRTR